LFGIDPSVIPASLFANDMGGMSIALSICKSESIGGFNAFIVSSMLGCVISFTIPFSIGIVKREQHKELFFGLLCGIVTVPVGCFVAGLVCGLGAAALLLNLLPLVLISLILGALLIFLPRICMKCFAVFGAFMRVLGVVGLAVAIFTFLTKIQLSPYFDSLENAAFICVNACVTLSGMLPLMAIVALVIYIDDPQGSPFFSQLRCGRDGKLFKMHKFRSMYVDAEDRLAEILKEKFASLGCDFFMPPQTNQLFPILGSKVRQKLAQKYTFIEMDPVGDDARVCRFCTSWATREENVAALCEDLEKIFAETES
jgi:hypothetical protein